MTIPRFPDITVRLVGKDGNAFAILGRVLRALTDAGVEKAERDAFYAEATSGDYNHLLATAMRWVEVMQRSKLVVDVNVPRHEVEDVLEEGGYRIVEMQPLGVYIVEGKEQIDAHWFDAALQNKRTYDAVWAEWVEDA